MSIDPISATIDFVKASLKDIEPGHDWWHTCRVWRTARFLQQQEGGCLLDIELAALLHDIADSKFHQGNEDIGPQTAQQWLDSIGVNHSTAAAVSEIIRHISFKGAAHEEFSGSIEFAIVHDADRLDALGAIGIGRAFSYGGYTQRPLFDPTALPQPLKTAKQYKGNTEPTVNHFFDKLLLLKERMLTDTGKELAEERHQTLIRFLHDFFDEYFEFDDMPSIWRQWYQKIDSPSS
jgi:uncharacterized protein